MTIKEPIDSSILDAFDEYLFGAGKSLSASIVGGGVIYLIARARVTGDIDSITKLPDDIKPLIESFARENDIPKNWFNDNASNIASDFLKSGENSFDVLLYEGKALKLFSPAKADLLLSKICAMIDRAAGQDLDDIESLINEGFISEPDYDLSLSLFEDQLPDMDPTQRSYGTDVLEILKTQKDEFFPPSGKSPSIPVTPTYHHEVETSVCSVRGCDNKMVFRKGTSPERRAKRQCSDCFKKRS